jgi:hypothetical protein
MKCEYLGLVSRHTVDGVLCVSYHAAGVIDGERF